MIMTTTLHLLEDGKVKIRCKGKLPQYLPGHSHPPGPRPLGTCGRADTRRRSRGCSSPTPPANMWLTILTSINALFTMFRKGAY